MAIFSGLEGFTSQLKLVEKCFGNVVLKKPKCLKSTALFQLPAQGNVYNKLNVSARQPHRVSTETGQQHKGALSGILGVLMSSACNKVKRRLDAKSASSQN